VTTTRLPRSPTTSSSAPRLARTPSRPPRPTTPSPRLRRSTTRPATTRTRTLRPRATPPGTRSRARGATSAASRRRSASVSSSFSCASRRAQRATCIECLHLLSRTARSSFTGRRCRPGFEGASCPSSAPVRGPLSVAGTGLCLTPHVLLFLLSLPSLSLRRGPPASLPVGGRLPHQAVKDVLPPSSPTPPQV